MNGSFVSGMKGILKFPVITSKYGREDDDSLQPRCTETLGSPTSASLGTILHGQLFEVNTVYFTLVFVLGVNQCFFCLRPEGNRKIPSNYVKIWKRRWHFPPREMPKTLGKFLQVHPSHVRRHWLSFPGQFLMLFLMEIVVFFRKPTKTREI